MMNQRLGCTNGNFSKNYNSGCFIGYYPWSWCVESKSNLAGLDNGTNNRGVIGGGDAQHEWQRKRMDYITISSTGNASVFGNILEASKGALASCSNDTNNRGIWAGGGNRTKQIEYITISSTGNALDFGDLTVGRYYLGGTSNGTNNRGIFGGGEDGYSHKNIIDYITISSTGNATDFGDLTVNARVRVGSTSNKAGQRGVWANSIQDGHKHIDYVTISTKSNASDFGNLSQTRDSASGCSNA